MHSLCISVLVHAFVVPIISAKQASYRAAVLEYPPVTDGATALENWKDNLKEILHFIQDASNQRAQIIVLPEDGFSGWNVQLHDVEILSTEIPDPAGNSLLCTAYNNNNFSSTLRDLSCAAQKHSIYVVANLIERAYEPGSAKVIYYNTNVAFDRAGLLIARHRKINLFNEYFYKSGNEVVTFTTDFGVTFGMFICFDIVFKTPSEEILKQYNVTDIAYSVAWISHFPFYPSLSVQHGYAKALGVNLLAAGLNDPSNTMGGSGIYLADGRITETFISGTPLSKLIIQDVPIIHARTPNSSCKLQKSSGSYEWGVDPMTGNISEFKTLKEDMRNYTFKSLNFLERTDVLETICSGSSSFCCTFNISVSRTHNVVPNYAYKLAAFQGTWKLPTGGTIGIRNCAIVACVNDNSDTCGLRKSDPPRGITFERISVKATLDNKDVRYAPVTVTFNLKPATDYTYCALENANNIDITMATTDSHDSLLTFGLMGRVFGYDGLPEGPINKGSLIRLSVALLFVITTLRFIVRC